MVHDCGRCISSKLGNMVKRILNLQSDIVCALIKISQEEKDFSEFSSENDEETVFLRKYCRYK
jgi:hypothetical protein